LYLGSLVFISRRGVFSEHPISAAKIYHIAKGISPRLSFSLLETTLHMLKM